VEKIPVDASPRILDLCCGSGCIGITLKLRIPSSAVYMSDVSSAAADVARRNAERLSADVSVGTGDLFENIRDRNFDLIISNPPYIPENECSLLQEEVKKEPLTALDGGNDGLDFYRRICREAPDYLRRGGILMFELGDGQHSAVGKMMEESGFQSVEIRKDFRQISRMISGLKC
jgi:release factor glutamine methyltransferase